MLASQIAQARSSADTNEIGVAASSINALKNVIKFELPTVTDSNTATHKVGCQAMMDVTADAATQQLLTTAGLTVNEVTPDHLQLRIGYSLQPAADTGETVLDLGQASGLAAVALEASMAAVQRVRDASGSTTSAVDASSNSVEANPPVNSSASSPPAETAPIVSTLPSESGDFGLVTSARTFADEYFQRSSGNPDAALAWMSGHYADVVRFFGKDTDRSDILKQKADYLHRWPDRSYTIEPNSVTVQCRPDQSSCHVAGIIDWSAGSEERKAHASGKAAFDLLVQRANNQIMIVAENSRVISRAP